MGYVTPEQIAQAKEWDLLTYLQRYDPHQLVHVGGSKMCIRDRPPTAADGISMSTISSTPVNGMLRANPTIRATSRPITVSYTHLRVS